MGNRLALCMRISGTIAAIILPAGTMMTSRPQAHAQTAPVEGTIRVTPAISSAVAGEPFAVYIVLEDLQHYGKLLYDDNRDTPPDREVASDGLAAFEFSIEYDDGVLSAGDVELGPWLDRTGRTFSCLSPTREVGRLAFGCFSPGPEPPGPQGSLTLATVTFLPLRAGSSPLLLDAELAGPLGSDEVPIDLAGGVVRIAAGAPDPAPAATNVLERTAVAQTQTAVAPLLATTETPESVLMDTQTPRQGGAVAAGGDSSSGGMLLLVLGVVVGAMVAAAAVTGSIVLWRRSREAA